MELTEETAPWAYDRGQPYRAIAALELLASVVAVACLHPFALDKPGIDGQITITGLTDSAVSAAVMTRGMTTKFPLVLVMMEMAALLESRAARLDLNWVPRDTNSEADALSNGNTQGFDPALRQAPTVGSVPFEVLPTLIREARAFYQNAREVRAAGKRFPREKPVPKDKRLRVCEPS